jgi:hypothetical protein
MLWIWNERVRNPDQGQIMAGAITNIAVTADQIDGGGQCGLLQ